MKFETKNGHSMFTLMSALQKFIRRGMEKQALAVVIEAVGTSKAFATWTCNRLEIISHEDVGLANPQAIQITHLACEQARRFWEKDKLGKALMPLTNAVLMLCRSPKTRLADHALIAAKLGDDELELPDWIFDGHTAKGKAMGRGLEYFQEESSKLIQPEADSDPIADPYKSEYEDILEAIQAIGKKLPELTREEVQAKIDELDSQKQD